VTFDRTKRACLQAFLVAGVTLLSQVLIHRIVSAKLLTNYSFLVISMTMLGFAVSGVILSRFLARFLEDESSFLNLTAALFALTLIASTWAFYRAPAWSQFVVSRPDFVRGFLVTLPLALLYAVPFTFCGLALGFLLSAPGLGTQRIYFFDLLGSAVGAAFSIPCLSRLGPERGILVGAALLLSTTALLWRPRRLVGWVVLVAGAASGVAIWQPERVFQMRYPPGTRNVAPEYFAWDAIARIEVTRLQGQAPPAPQPCVRALLGEDPAFTGRFQKVLSQNNWAGTMAFAWDGRPESLSGIERTMYGAAYQATSIEAPRVIVIGVGAGMDVLTALHYGASQITGVEVNAATVDITTRVFADYFGPWARDPRVRLVVDDGRSFIAGRADRYDVIQLSGVDSFTGTAASPHIFSENYLYTSEAFDLYLSRLTEGGIVNVMRIDRDIPQAIPRLLATAVGALRRAGVQRPAAHLVTLTTDDGLFTAVLIKRTPFAPAEVTRLERWVRGSQTFGFSAAPGLSLREPNVFSTFLALADEQAERRFVASYPFDISPTTDDRPFFFRQSFWWHVFPAEPTIWRFVPIMEYSLILLLVVVGAAVVALVYLPLRWLPGSAGAGTSWGTGTFFGALGLGFMALEIAFLQKLGLFLGHPNYALSVVLATLLAASGLGSLLSPRLVAAVGQPRFLAYGVSGMTIVLHYLFKALPSLTGLSFAARVLVVVALVTPAAVLMGSLFPWGLFALRGNSPARIPWAWGVNGIFSVLGPLLAIAIAMTWGGNGLLLFAALIYVVAALASRALEHEPLP
jgi:spermidine synthase